MKKKDTKKEEKMEKMAKGGCVKMAAGGAAKSRRAMPMTKPVPKKK